MYDDIQEMVMENNIYREKVIKNMSKPDELKDYLRVQSPMMWILLIAVFIIMVGAGIWAYFVYNANI